MMWEDEQYVRLYTRDTVDWDMWPWQARALLPLVMRRLNRAGVLELGKHGVVGLAAAVKMPVEVVEPGLTSLLEDGCLVLNGTTLAMPNYLEAQECKRTDRARKQEQRERERSKAVTPRDQESRFVTESHAPSHAVTGGHTESHSVTLCSALPCSALPCSEEELLGLETPAPPPASPSQPPVPDDPESPQPTAPKVDPVVAVYEHWVAGWSKHVGGVRRPKLDAKRRGKVRDRLREGHTVDDLKHAIDGLFSSRWHLGDNDRGKRFVDLELVCRDTKHVEDFMQMATDAAAKSSARLRPKLPPSPPPDEPTLFVAPPPSALAALDDLVRRPQSDLLAEVLAASAKESA